MNYLKVLGTIKGITSLIWSFFFMLTLMNIATDLSTQQWVYMKSDEGIRMIVSLIGFQCVWHLIQSTMIAKKIDKTHWKSYHNVIILTHFIKLFIVFIWIGIVFISMNLYNPHNTLPTLSIIISHMLIFPVLMNRVYVHLNYLLYLQTKNIYIRDTIRQFFKRKDYHIMTKLDRFYWSHLWIPIVNIITLGLSSIWTFETYINQKAELIRGN